MEISLCMITKGEIENLKRLAPLVRDYVDEWVVVVPPGDEAIPFLEDKATVIVQDFTQPIEPDILAKMKEFGLEVDEKYRLFNFAAARNASLKAATKDYVLWLDADDTPKGIENLRTLIKRNPNIDVFDAIYDYYRDEENNPISDHIRERLVKNNGKWTWRGGKLGLIHETLLPDFDPLRFNVPEDVFRVEHNTDHVDESSMRNHIALLYEYLKTEGEDPRTTYYLGIEFFNRKMYEYSIKVLAEYVKASGWDEERYQAYIKMGQAYHMLGDRVSGRNYYLVATTEMPHYPHAYLNLGESYHQDGMWGKSNEFIITGLQKQLPNTKYVIDKTALTFRPAVYVALNYQELGMPDKAYEWFVKAANINPKEPWIKEHAPHFQRIKDLSDYVKAFVKLGQLSQVYYPKTLSKIAEVVPDELMEQEVLMDFRWRYSRPKVWSDKSVVFFCSHAFEDWGPESLEKGCGGSEEAVIQLSKRLVKLGYEVTVFNNCIKEGVVDGVNWVRYERFNPRDIFNVLISWRNNFFLDRVVVAKKKFIDMHDVPDPKLYTDAALGKDVKIFVKSKFHRQKLPKLADDRFITIPNGIDLGQFPETKEKTKNNLIWTSSYDRGLEHLLEMWPDIRKEVPDATLDTYYGFALFDTTPWGKKPSGQAWKHKMIGLLKQEGITDHGRVGSDEVAKAYLKADVFAYPTDFPEISCISLMKAQAARAIPITSSYAAMPETNKYGIVLEGIGGEPKFQKKFKRELIKLLKDESRKAEIRKQMDDKRAGSEWSWDKIAKQWVEHFK